MSEKKVLVIDDEDFIRELVKDFLELEEVHCSGAEDADAALEIMKHNTFDLILLDRNLGRIKAEDFLPTIKEMQQDVPVLILTGDQQCDTDFMRQIGAEGLLYKPFQVMDFMKCVGKFLELE